MDKKQIEQLNQKFQHSTAEEILAYFLSEYKGKIALASSLGAEDQVLTHIVTKIDKDTEIFTLDTGRLFSESYNVIERTNERYDIKIKTYFPQSSEVEAMVNEKGINLFYTSIENRKQCCQVRKLNPLKRAFENLDVWICGLRRSQAVTRRNVQPVEWDELNNLLKINPLINWNEEQVWKFIKANHIPYNKLHDKGFRSIGCQPCTRAIKEGEDVRAGRWWWENPETKECGLHKR